MPDDLSRSPQSPTQNLTPRPQGCVAATATIWGCSTGMLAADLLFSTEASSEAIIAIAIVTAAAASTMTVWLSGHVSTSATAESLDPESHSG
ncbi:MAG: hypothetical protein KME07_12315 [Pegethrix bostrychoides GSE-TBD4-15B]|uniref:Uncharacterized protein n=1 Tax=Pegethrix bostrychoides GSE-TBD4-15B TaxID=2839662 RepID=A0A951PB32_9CYAN|nr:hypothetical protein [Pegethrix bostrychoides GSE-TBD4-15B]